MQSKILAGILCLSLSVPAQTPMEPGSVPGEARGKPANSSPAPSPTPLSAEEESSLAARAEEPGPEVAGGALTNQQLTYIVIALAAAVFVLIVK